LQPAPARLGWSTAGDPAELAWWTDRVVVTARTFEVQIGRNSAYVRMPRTFLDLPGVCEEATTGRNATVGGEAAAV
jgi:hypothetical protein